jgi:hypothetical protein
MGIFDELLAKVDENDRAVIEKYPSLKESMEKLEKAALDYAAWYRDNWDEQHGMTKSEWEARQELEAARLRLQELQANPQDFSAPEASEILEQARKAGMVTQAEVQRLLDERLRAIQQQNDQILAGMQNFYSQVYTLGFQHKDEFGQPLDPSELYQFMVKTGLRDAKLAYEQMVAPKRAELAAKKHEEELRAAEQRGMEKARQELAMATPGLPTDNTGGIIGVTHPGVSKAEIPQELAEKTKGLSLTDPELARIGVDALRRGILTQ